MTEKLDEVINKYFKNVIKNSWTWERLTEEEKRRFVNLDIFSEIKGNKDAREQWLFTIYAGFLFGCGYDDFGWRETEEEKKNRCF